MIVRTINNNNTFKSYTALFGLPLTITTWDPEVPSNMALRMPEGGPGHRILPYIGTFQTVPRFLG